jgi:hypothetical protein
MGLLSALGLATAQVRSAQPAATGMQPAPPMAAALGSSVATKTATELRELARWPGDAHRAWKKLTTMDRVAVLEGMGKLYGKAFADSFLKFTKGGQKLEQHHYVTAQAHQTPQWFENLGYKLAQSSTYQQWWVHPNGHLVFLVLESTPEELKRALDRILKSIAKADADDVEVSEIGHSLDLLWPFPIKRPSDPLAAFNDYVAKLSTLETFLEGELAWAARTREALVKKGVGTSEFDEQVGALTITLGSVQARLKEENLDDLDPTKSTGSSNSPPIDPKDVPDPIDYSGGKGP